MPCSFQVEDDQAVIELNGIFRRGRERVHQDADPASALARATEDADVTSGQITPTETAPPSPDEKPTRRGSHEPSLGFRGAATER